MSGFNAIEQGVDLRQYARALSVTHDAVLGGATPRVRPRPVVAESWRRVIELGLDPDGGNRREPTSADRLEMLRRMSPLNMVIDEIKNLIGSVAEASQLLLVVTDAEGVILWRGGAASTRMRADRLGFVDGAVWTEAAVGTNAIGTAIAEASPVQLFSAEHFEQQQHPWYCTAAPIHDPRTGELLGIVDVSGPALTLHPTICALVEAAVRMAELELFRRHQVELDRLRRTAAPTLAAVRGPLLLVDEHGWIAHSSGIAAGSRVAIPRGDRAITVPGLGLCLPEPVAGGWLVRPGGTESRVRLVLDLTSRPIVEVDGGQTPWRSPLTTRHAEILLLLQLAGPAGLRAAALSTALYGDADHIVAVRAEVSRLRKLLGTVIDTRPYRIARGAELRIEPVGREGLLRSPLVRDSLTPGLRPAVDSA